MALATLARIDLYRRIEVNHIAGLAGHHQLLHVIAGAGVEHAAALRNTHNRDGVGAAISQQIGAFHRVNGHVKAGAAALADLFAVKEHGGIVLFAFADNDLAIDAEGGEADAHGVNGGAVTGLLVSPTEPAADARPQPR